MTIQVKGVPNTQLTPFLFVNIEAGVSSQLTSTDLTCLVLGHKLNSGTASENTLQLAMTAEQVASYFGEGSMLHYAAKAYFKNASRPLTVLAVPEPSGTAATAAITFTASGVKAGNLSLSIASDHFTIPITNNMTASAIATAAKTELDKRTDLPFASAVSGAVLTLTAKHKGLSFDKFAVTTGLRGETLPQGIGLSVTHTAGSGVADVSAAINVIGDGKYHLIASPFNDASNLSKIKVFAESRFGALEMNLLHHFTAFRDTHANLTTKGASLNDKHLSAFALHGNTPAYDFEITAAALAQVASSASTDPALPFQFLSLKGLPVAKPEDRFIMSERNTLLAAGLATLIYNVDVMQLERIVTTYKKNAAGAKDTTYQDLNSLLTADYLRTDFSNLIKQKYARYKLGDNGGLYAPSAKVVTPSTIKAEFVARYKRWEEAGLVENYDSIKDKIKVEKQGDRVNFYAPANLINQLRIVAGTISITE